MDDESVLTSRFPEKEFFKKMGETGPKQGGLSGVPLRKMVLGEINEVAQAVIGDAQFCPTTSCFQSTNLDMLTVFVDAAAPTH